MRAVLEKRGAIFFSEIVRAVGGLSDRDARRALAPGLVGRGDERHARAAPEPCGRGERADTSGTRRDADERGVSACCIARRSARRPPRRCPVPRGAGRCGKRVSESPRSDTERRAALARALLERYGVLTREAVHAEGIEGGFSAVYDVLKAMEDGGARAPRLLPRRGAGRRSSRSRGPTIACAPCANRATAPRTMVLAATDPANPYGATLPWPTRARGDGDDEARRPQRAAGALVDPARWGARRVAGARGGFATDVPPRGGGVADAVARRRSRGRSRGSSSQGRGGRFYSRRSTGKRRRRAGWRGR